MASMKMQEHRDHVALIVLSAGILGLMGYQMYTAKYAMRKRGGDNARYVAASGIYGAALDDTFGMVTPEHLIHYGPTMRPASWTPHRVTYPETPGVNLERLIYGASGACDTVTPRAQRGWLFAPPSEVDI